MRTLVSVNWRFPEAVKQVTRAVMMLACIPVLAGCEGIPDMPWSRTAQDVPLVKAEVRLEPDDFLRSYPVAAQAMTGHVAGSVLVTAGTNGLAPADEIRTWRYTFYSTVTGHFYTVSVTGGRAGGIEDLGAAAEPPSVDTVVRPESISYGAASAVERARASGLSSGALPGSVEVSGSFALLTGDAEAGIQPGRWTVRFASGTDTADAVKFYVNMSTGEVSLARR